MVPCPTPALWPPLQYGRTTKGDGHEETPRNRPRHLPAHRNRRGRLRRSLASAGNRERPRDRGFGPGRARPRLRERRAAESRRQARMHGGASRRPERPHPARLGAARARPLDLISTGDDEMNSDQIHGHLRNMKGWALESWGRVTHDPWLRIAGRRERLLGRLEASLAESRRIAETSFPTRVVGAADRRRAASR